MARICRICHKHTVSKARSCGHAFHTRCAGSRCPVCSKAVSVVHGGVTKATKKSVVQPCVGLDNATKRLTESANGDIYMSVTQRDQWGHTTVIRHVKADKAHEFAAATAAASSQQQKSPATLNITFGTKTLTESAETAKKPTEQPTKEPAKELNLGKLFMCLLSQI